MSDTPLKDAKALHREGERRRQAEQIAAAERAMQAVHDHPEWSWHKRARVIFCASLVLRMLGAKQ